MPPTSRCDARTGLIAADQAVFEVRQTNAKAEGASDAERRQATEKNAEGMETLAA